MSRLSSLHQSVASSFTDKSRRLIKPLAQMPIKFINRPQNAKPASLCRSNGKPKYNNRPHDSRHFRIAYRNGQLMRFSR